MDGEKSMRPQPYAKNDRQLSNTKCGRNNLHGRAHKLAIQYQVIIPENMHKHLLAYHKSKLHFS